MKRTQHNFSKNLSRIRKSKGISQINLAKISGLSQRMISSYENGSVSPPLDNIYALAEALKVEIDDLLDKSKEVSKHDEDALQFDSRTKEKFKMILALPKSERHIIYTLAEALLLKLENDKKKKVASNSL